MTTSDFPIPPSLAGLVELAHRSGADVRPTLLRVLTDLFVQKQSHTAAEIKQYLDLALKLIEVVDPATRSIVAGRLVLHPNAPAALLGRLVTLGALSDMPGLAAAEKTHAAPAPTAPTSVSRPAAPPLRAASPRTEVAPAAPKAAIAKVLTRTLAKAAPNATSNAAPKPAAAPASANEFLSAFLAAEPDKRRVMLMAVAPRSGSERRVRFPADTARLLEAAALQRDTLGFARVVERNMALGGTVAQTVATDSSGELLAVTARAAGMSREACQRVLMFLNPEIGRSARRVYDLSALFDDIGQQAAETVVDRLRGETQRRAPAHQPQHHDDERQSARAASTPSQRLAARRAPLAERYRGNGR